MHDWRTRAWYQIGQLEGLLAAPGPEPDPEVRRRKDIWTAIDRFSWPQFKEPQFGQLELLTRTEADLLRYLLPAPPARELLAATTAPELPPRPEAFPDWRSRALFQVGALAEVLGGPADPEVRRRGAMWLAIEKFAWPQLKEPQFALVELLTRTEGDLLRYLLQSPPARELILPTPAPPPSPSPAPARAPEPAPSPAPVSTPAAPVDDPADPLGAIAPVERYKGPSASQLYKEGTAAWGEFAKNEYKEKAKAREAARRLREICVLLDKNPDSETQVRALEQVTGLSLKEILNNTLDRRLR